MSDYRAGYLTSEEPGATSALAPGVWSLADAIQAQADGNWPTAATNDFEAAVVALFASSEPGFWMDPSDLSTMYQDATGLIPVTDVEQPVGLVLDKSRGKPFYGPERITNGDFSQGATGWTAGSGATIANGAVVCSDVDNFLYQDNVFVVGKRYRITFDVRFISGNQLRLSGATALDGGTQRFTTATGQKVAIVIATGTTLGIEAEFATFSGTVSNISVREFPTFCAFQEVDSRRPTLSRRHNMLVGTSSLATQSVTTIPINYTLTFSGAGSITLSGTSSGTFSAGTNTFTATAGTLTLTVTGTVTNAQLVPTSKANLPYQWVVNNTSYDKNPGLFPAYLRVQQNLSQNLKGTTITPGTDKAQLFAGISTITNGDFPMILETSASADSNAGSLYLLGPLTSTASRLRIRGTSEVTVFTDATELNAGRIVYSGTGDIAAPLAVIRKNGVPYSSTASSGTGNFLEYPVYFFSRNGTGLFFGGECYGIILRFGPNLSGTQIANVEAYIASKSGVTI